MKDQMKLNKTLSLWLVFGALTRIFLSKYGTHYPDLYTYQEWSLGLITHGFGHFYQNVNSDYTPGYLYVLWFLGKVFWYFLNHSFLLPFELFYKSPSMASDLVNSILIYLIVKQFAPTKKAHLSAIFFLFNPAVLINSTIWGQVDSFMSFFLLISFLLLIKNKTVLSAIFLGLGQAVKPVAIILLPLYLIYLWKKGISLLNIFIFILSFSLPILISFIPFALNQNIFQLIVQRYTVTTSFYPYITVNAFNFWALFSTNPAGNLNDISDQLSLIGISYHTLGILLFLICFGVLIYKLFKAKLNKDFTYLLAFIISLSYLFLFLFFTRMHERHLFYALPFLSIILTQLSKKQIAAVLYIFCLYTFNSLFGLRFAWGNPLILQPLFIILISLLLVTTSFYLLYSFSKTPTS